MKKVFLWGFTSRAELGIVESLKKRGRCEVVFHSARSSKDAAEIGNINHCRLSPWTHIPYDKSVYDEVSRGFLTYFYCHNRQKQVFLWPEKYYDFIDFFNIYFQLFYRLLKERKPDVVLFSNVPHLGADYVLYLTARAMGFKVRMFYQTIFPNKFIMLDSIESLGDFSGMPILNDETFEIKNAFEKELFYMKKRHSGVLAHLGKMSRLYMVLIDIYKWRYSVPYRRRLKKAAVKEADFSKKYVYFAMHLQPEMTTTPLAKGYDDQALAIEHLSDMLPPDWLVYVKENPYQDEFRRGRGFFDRMRALKNVRIVPPDTNTYTLMRNSQFVSTITGTVGWESISGGKSVLVFGPAWYRSLPGVFEYSHSLKAEDIAAFRIDHAELQDRFNEMYRKLRDGITDFDYIRNYPDYDEGRNIELVCRTIEEC